VQGRGPPTRRKSRAGSEPFSALCRARHCPDPLGWHDCSFWGQAPARIASIWSHQPLVSPLPAPDGLALRFWLISAVLCERLRLLWSDRHGHGHRQRGGRRQRRLPQTQTAAEMIKGLVLAMFIAGSLLRQPPRSSANVCGYSGPVDTGTGTGRGGGRRQRRLPQTQTAAEMIEGLVLAMFIAGSLLRQPLRSSANVCGCSGPIDTGTGTGRGGIGAIRELDPLRSNQRNAGA
jgi:hypothetical protein